MTSDAPFGNTSSMTIEEYLEAKQLSDREFAFQLGVHPSAVGRWISGARRPELETVVRIIEVTGGLVQPKDMLVERRPPAQVGEASGF